MNGASTFLLFVRVGFSLAIVLGLIWLAARVAKRRGKIAARQTDIGIELVARRQVGRRASLVVVESAGRRFLVGVTDSRVDLVADLPVGELSSPVEVGSQPLAVSSQPVERPLPVESALRQPVESASPMAVPPMAVPLRPVEPVDPTELPRRESLVDALRDLTVRR